MYVMLCMQRQSSNCIHEICRYLLILTAKNATANELQYLSNKTNKQTNKKTEKYILRLSFKTQLKD